MEEFKDLFFEQDELEYRDKSILKTFSPNLAYQDFDSDVGQKFHDFKIIFSSKKP